MASDSDSGARATSASARSSMIKSIFARRRSELLLQLLPILIAFSVLFTRRQSSLSPAMRSHLAKRTWIRTLGDTFIRPWLYWLFHSGRLFSYLYVLPVALVAKPAATAAGLLAYAAIHRQPWWQRALHRALGYGASRRHKIVSLAQDAISKDKRYLWVIHPHSILADGWHSIIARNIEAFSDKGNGPPCIHRKIALCFAPVISHVPVHQEMYRNLCDGADRKSIIKYWNTTPDTDPALIPGGFAEAVFANAGEKDKEYLYIKDRKGFMKICLEERKDLVPMYTFKASWMYYNPGILKGLRARISQKISVGLVAFFGRFGTSMPLIDDTTTVIFPPFEISKYRPDQVDEAHADYLQHVKLYFDKHKADYGMGQSELVFVGNDFEDDDIVAQGLRKLGLMNKKKAQKSQGPPMSKL
mmetsp:Transcript_289/g.625  ORF Transcript_289/g.625 Transcript_289/m.625 type:complete len:415 (-) Transcript_289:335-1579(-)